MPVGSPDAAKTLAVKVTVWPNVVELCDELSVVVVPALLTVSVSVALLPA